VRFRCCPYRPLCCQIKCLFQVALDAADRGLVEAGGLPLFGDEGLIGGYGEPQRPGEVLLLGPRRSGAGIPWVGALHGLAESLLGQGRLPRARWRKPCRLRVMQASSTCEGGGQDQHFLRHTLTTLARWCRIRSYLDSATSHGLTALHAIRAAIEGNPGSRHSQRPAKPAHGTP
jgi:hypothetical protein